MTTNAHGQLLGFSLQYPRALYHLLCCGPGDRVCVEVVGDVATQYKDGKITTEEDKSSITSNPVTNSSVNLWKTFYNWINAINATTFDADKTRFILYTNKAGKKALVNTFHNVKTEQDADEALKLAKTKLKKIDAKHEIWEYYDFVVNQNPDLFKAILPRFDYQVIDGGTGFKEVEQELLKKLISKVHIEFLIENLGGWLQRELMEKISKNEPAVVVWDVFQEKFTVLVERIHKRELIDFALEPAMDQLENEKTRRPVYIQQLDKIGLSDEEILEEVAKYLRASVNRSKWIEHEIIDENVAQDFEDRLYQYWKVRLRSLKITEKHVTSNERGKLLLYDCQVRDEKIRDMSPPSSTIAGTYHALADTPLLGWHEDWEKIFK